MEKKTKLLQARVTEQVHEAVTKQADKYGVPRCQIVRWALEAYVYDKEVEEANDEAR